MLFLHGPLDGMNPHDEHGGGNGEINCVIKKLTSSGKKIYLSIIACNIDFKSYIITRVPLLKFLFII